MGTNEKKSGQTGGSGDMKEVGEQHTHAIGDICRCKETAVMKPRQLFRLMLDDLSFWKKKKKA
jgi:hypothetical protein